MDKHNKSSCHGVEFKDSCNISKTSASVSSGVPNTEKRCVDVLRCVMCELLRGVWNP